MKIIKSKLVSLLRKDIDTDLIIPAEYLKTTVKVGLGQHLFARIKNEIGLDEFKGRSILIAGENFACGSSREHAAWALNDWGIRVVIAPSFADIFYNNAMKNGIVPISLDLRDVDAEGEWEVNLPEQIVISPSGSVYKFEIDSYRKQCLIEGIDDMDYLLANKEAIFDFDQKHADKIFFDTNKL